MVKGVTSLIISITISAFGWVLAVRPLENSAYQLPAFIRKRLKGKLGPQYEILYEKLHQIEDQQAACNEVILSKLKLSLRLLDCRFRESDEQCDHGERIVKHKPDFWASNFGVYSYSNSFYEDMILDMLILLSTDSKSKRELLCEYFWKEFFVLDGAEIDLKHSKLLLPILQMLANVSTLPEGSKLVKNLGLTDWIVKQAASNSPAIALESWRLYQNLKSNLEITYSNKVYPLIPPYDNQDPLVDIIFVHGIKGGASWTWRQHDSEKNKPPIDSTFRERILSNQDGCHSIMHNFYTWIWPLDWLKTTIKCPSRIIALNYQADWWENSNILNDNYNLEELSENISQDLISAGIGTRPIIWVTHSLGGLLLKNIFHTVSSKAKEKASLDLCSSTKGVVFYSVPHFGSGLSSWTYVFTCVFKPSSLLYCMTSDKSYLRKIHETFVRLCEENNIEILNINETKPASITAAGPKVLFVPPECGNPGIGVFHEVDSSHMDVCKPMNRTAPSYVIMQEFISKLVKVPL